MASNETAVKCSYDDLPKASSLNLSDFHNRKFICKRNGATTEVYLHGVRRGKVQLKEELDRVDSFTLSVAEFGKFYRLSQ